MTRAMILFNGSGEITPGFQKEIGKFADDFAGAGAFSGFEASRQYDYTDALNLELDAGCPILIIPSPDGFTRVAIDADPEDLKHFRVSQTGNTISIMRTSSIISISQVSGSVLPVGQAEL